MTIATREPTTADQEPVPAGRVDAWGPESVDAVAGSEFVDDQIRLHEPDLDVRRTP